MKLSDAISNIDKSDSNLCYYPDFDIFCDELGISIHSESGYCEEYNNEVKGYYLIAWYCTDTTVGNVVYFYKDKPIAISSQAGRKSDIIIEFFSMEDALLLKAFIISLHKESELNLNFFDLDTEISDYYTVQYSSQLITNIGFYKNKQCIVINYFKGDFISKKLEVKFQDDTTKIIDVKDFHIKLRLNCE